MKTLEDVIQRVRAEYMEMPGMRLKTEQVQRLCGIERMTCQLVLNALVDARFLCVKAGRALRTRHRGTFSRPPCNGTAENRHAFQKGVVSVLENRPFTENAKCSG